MARRDFSVEGNLWKQVVFNEFEERSLTYIQEDLLSYVRKALNNPTVQLKIEIDSTKAESFLNAPNPIEQKIQKVLAENPRLKDLWEAFDLRIIQIRESSEGSPEAKEE